MSTHERPLIGSVFERTTPRTSSAPSSRFTGTPGTGFPTAQHRFKSAFARGREKANANVGGSRRTDVPSVVSKNLQAHPPVAPTSPIVDSKPIPTDADALRRRIHEENARTIARMSEAEVEQEKRAVLEQLGEGTEQLLRRVQEARRRKETKEKEAQARAELEEQATQDVQGEVGSTINDDDARRTTEHDRDHEQVTLVASPSPRRVSHELASKPGVLRVKSLENIGQSGKIYPGPR